MGILIETLKLAPQKECHGHLLFIGIIENYLSLFPITKY